MLLHLASNSLGLGEYLKIGDHGDLNSDIVKTMSGGNQIILYLFMFLVVVLIFRSKAFKMES